MHAARESELSYVELSHQWEVDLLMSHCTRRRMSEFHSDMSYLIPAWVRRLDEKSFNILLNEQFSSFILKIDVEAQGGLTFKT